VIGRALALLLACILLGAGCGLAAAWVLSRY